MLSGSNHPFWLAADCLSGLDTLGLDEPTRQAFLHDDAAPVFDLAH